MPSNLIRDREPGDLDDCVAALAAVHNTSGYPTNWPADPARWLAPAGTLHAWIATAADTPVAGHVILRQLPTGAAEVSRLFVTPSARRQGIALALLQKAMRWAAASDTDLTLEVTADLRDARALYERAGFRLTGVGRADWTAPGGQPVTVHRYAWRGPLFPGPPAAAVPVFLHPDLAGFHAEAAQLRPDVLAGQRESLVRFAPYQRGELIPRSARQSR